ncbi:NUDIX hydrolase [Aliiruegeria sabulilitoris]|uniref:NUDIX hydrolase n=1 Tax=Aliiruegeria sabulilitoris TaxID=1510458 RepID=UPI00082E34BA|nr:NUDIX hydrolase [Aliiruegeria sabulilitoris]NDR59366.1 NUDIX hydrolase [Pseudoruegeria sp. M32A2M]
MQENFKLPKGLTADKDVRTQYGALCYRVVNGKPQVLLITSRTSRRWIIPKGWPMRNVTPDGAAKIEAWEEAGVRGKAEQDCIGYFSYIKVAEAKGEKDLPCVVCVFPVKVKSLAKDFPECNQRRRKWFSPKQASKKVAEPELREILRNFDPGKAR